jgi:hypothetical protein
MRKICLAVITVFMSVAIANGQTCNTPASVSVGSITSTSASVTFTSAGNNFIVEYGPAGFTPGTAATPGAGGTIVTGTASPVNLPSLSANTIYDLYVREVCTGPAYSANTTVFTFTTDCAVIIPVYNQNFSSYIPGCWKEQTGILRTTPSSLTGISSLWENGIWLNSTSNASPVLNLNGTGKHEWLVSPSINLGTGGNYQLEFDLATLEFFNTIPTVLGSDDSLAVVVSTDNGATWSTTNIIGLWTTANTPVSASGLHVSIPLTTYTGLVKIGFYGTDGTVTDAQNADVMIDNFAIISCAAPAAVSIGSITSTTASVSFTGTGTSFIVEYGPVGFIPGTGASAGVNGTIQTGSASPIGLSGLTTGTTYDVYVRRNCSADGFSVNTAVVTFSTVCNATNIPYMEKFDGVTPPLVPACVIVENTGSNAETWRTHGLSGPLPDMAASAPNFMRLDYELDGITPADDWFFTQGLNLTGGTSYRLRFHYRNSDNHLYIESLQVKYGTAPNSAAMTTGTLYTNNAIDTSVWSEASVDFTPVSSGVYYIGFHGNSPADRALLGLDNINVIQTPACEPPQGISINSVTGSTAVVSFTSPGTNFIVEYGPVGFTPGTGASGVGGTIITTTSSPVMLTGLTGATIYDVYVRRDCGAGSFSPNTLPLSFLTGPVNDDAPGAIAITVDASCTGNSFTNLRATQSAFEPFASCEGTAGYHTVWYKFVAPAGGAVRISDDFVGSGLGDSRLAVFTATNVNDYSTFTILGCDDDNGVVGNSKSTIYLAGLIPGTTYYVQVDGYSDAVTQGSFCLEVKTLASSMIAATASCGNSLGYANLNAAYRGWVSLVDNSGNIIANVKQTAGTATDISAGITVNTSGVRIDPVSAQYYLDRNYFLQATGLTTADVQFFFLNNELNALHAVDSAVSITNIGATRQTGVVCQSGFVSSNGTNSYLAQTGRGSVNGVSWINASTPGFSNFYLHASKAPVTIKTFLQGAYSTTGLGRHKDVTTIWRDVLRNNATSQPFNTTAFGNYNGGENVPATRFNSTAGTSGTAIQDIVDWVLLELRSSAPPALPVATRAAFIREDGAIVDLDGVSSVAFRGVPNGTYYVSIRHRNHLGIRTAAVQVLDGALGSNPAPAQYNFSTSLAQAFKDAAITTNEAMALDAGSGAYLMWGGNANQDNSIRVTTLLLTQGDPVYILGTVLSGNPNTVLSSVYSPADVNMDGTVRINTLLLTQGERPFILGTALGGNPSGLRREHK